jgi:dTDP-glucose 4,6-dehydratase
MRAMDTIIVTGGAGFIGANFTRLALKKNVRVVVVDKLTYAGNLASLKDISNDRGYSFVRADIADQRAMESLIKKTRPSAIVNFAAETHVDRSIDGPRAFMETNTMGVFVLLEAFRHYANAHTDREKSKLRFLHVSTDEVYGSLGPRGLFKENSPYAPNSPYSASKAGADHLVRAYHETYNLPTIITNCSNNYGPFQFPEKLIPLMILNALDGKPLPIYGDGKNIRDWLYVEDHCTGIWLALTKGRPGQKYNIGGRNERRNVDIVNKICSTLEKVAPAHKNKTLLAKGFLRYKELRKFVQDRPGHDRRYAIDAAKIRRELGWKPKYNFEKGLEETVRWYVANADWCRTVQSGKYGRERLGLKR